MHKLLKEKAEQNLNSVRLLLYIPLYILYGIGNFIKFYQNRKSGKTISALPLINVSPNLTVVADIVNLSEAKRITDAFVLTEFDNDTKQRERVAMIKSLEE